MTRSGVGNADRGATLVISALVMTGLMIVAAIVVDLGATRNDRRAGQLSVDNAAASAAQTLAADGIETACQAAFDYLRLNLESDAFVGPACSTLAPCNPATGRTVTRTSDDYVATVHHPVLDLSPLMARTSTIGAETGGFTPDGTPCERVAVELTTSGAAFFGGAAGSTGRATTVHAVAIITPSTEPDRLVNLAVLERHDCDALTMSGSGGGVGGITVGAVDNGDGPEAGTVSVDSDGTGDECSTEDGTIDVDGANSVIRADGPPGCEGELTPGTGEGCGRIEAFAPGPPGCIAPACTSSGTIAPSPVRVATRLTRAPVDWKYNCKSSYPAELDIQGCPAASTTSDYIDQLTDAIGTSGTPEGFQVYGDDSSEPCTVEGAAGTTVTVATGNWHVTCTDLIVKRTLIFQGGNVVLDGDITIEANGDFRFNTESADATYSWTEGAAIEPLEHSNEAGYLYLRGGRLRKAGGARFELRSAFVYVGGGAESFVEFEGGSGELHWEAPSVGPFADLALWSEGEGIHRFAGQSATTLDGAFFAPLATVTYQGNGSGVAVEAQMIANKFHVSGEGLFTLSPRRGVPFPPEEFSFSLIR